MASKKTRSVKSYLTARARTKPSVPALYAYEYVISTRNYNSVLDWGAGKGEDILFFKEKGLRVRGYDPHFLPVKPKRNIKFDCVMCTYVINTLTRTEERLACIRNARKYLRRNGRMIITVRSDSEIAYEVGANDWVSHNDGWLTNAGTFQKGFNVVELSKLVTEAGATAISCQKISGGVLVVASK